MPSFSFKYQKADEIITYFTQEMLNEGFLANGSCYTMISHSNEIIKKYKIACEKVFKKVSKKIHNENFNFKKYLKGRVKFAKFKNPV